MSVSPRHILHQGPVLGALAKGAYRALTAKPSSKAPAVPGPWFKATLPPRSPELIAAYVRNVGGNPGHYRHTVPAHLFPQWTFPLQSKALEGVSYPIQKVLNGGCRLEVRGPLPQREALQVKTRLEGIDDNGRRAVLHFLAYTGTAADPELHRADLYAIVPLGKKGVGKKGGKKAEKPRISPDARAIEEWRLRHDAGLDYAKLTGDFNPIHWVPAYAKAFGFPNVVLHGFGSFARTWEGLVHGQFAGDPRRLRTLDVRFTKPLVLPQRVSLFTERREQGGDVFIGHAAGGPAYLKGTFEESNA